VVVNDLHLLWPSIAPPKADPPLVIDSDAVLTGTIALQGFEPIAWRDSKVIERLSGSHVTQLPQCNRVDPRIDRWHALTTPQTFGHLAPERSDHTSII
jgi:hypothetical protein